MLLAQVAGPESPPDRIVAIVIAIVTLIGAVERFIAFLAARRVKAAASAHAADASANAMTTVIGVVAAEESAELALAGANVLDLAGRHAEAAAIRRGIAAAKQRAKDRSEEVGVGDRLAEVVERTTKPPKPPPVLTGDPPP